MRIATLLLMCTTALAFAQQQPQSDADKQIVAGIKSLRSLPDDQRAKTTQALAEQIRQLPANMRKVQLADALSHLSTEGDPGHDALQAVTTTLAAALNETPVPSKDGKPAMVYRDIARLVRYEGMTADVKDPQFEQAMQELKASDAAIESSDFTLDGFNLKPLGMKKVTLSKLRGKVVMVNFWATWCPPCRKEMPTLQAIYEHFKGDVVVLSITDEDAQKVAPWLAQTRYTCPVLFDPGGKIAKQWGVEGIPQTFVLDRNGKLVAHAIDMRTQQQFLRMLAAAGVNVR